MRYQVEYLPEAIAALARMSPDVARRVIRKIGALENDLAGESNA